MKIKIYLIDGSIQTFCFPTDKEKQFERAKVALLDTSFDSVSNSNDDGTGVVFYKKNIVKAEWSKD